MESQERSNIAIEVASVGECAGNRGLTRTPKDRPRLANPLPARDGFRGLATSSFPAKPMTSAAPLKSYTADSSRSRSPYARVVTHSCGAIGGQDKLGQSKPTEADAENPPSLHREDG